MNGFYNKPLTKNLVLKAIVQHHFRMTEQHTKEFFDALDD